jgi:precorrin-2 dehydrogenase / sirohydrochlorin ferrochelatase
MTVPDPAPPAHYHPVFLDLRHRPCVVVGGGPLAAGKARELCAAGARVTVVAAAPAPDIEQLARTGQLALRRRPFRAGDLAGAFLAIAACEPIVQGTTATAEAADATGASNAGMGAAGRREAEVEAAWQEATRRGIPFNSVDDPRRSSFIAGSVARQGDLVVAISTSGKAPALAVRLRQALERQLGPQYARFLQLAGTLRAQVAARHPGFARRRELWYRLVDSDVLHLLRRGDEAAARRRCAEILEIIADPTTPAVAPPEKLHDPL